MTFNIPFTIASINNLKIKSKRFIRLFSVKKESNLKYYLERAEVDLSREEYLSIVSRSAVIFMIVSYILFSTFLFLIKKT